MTEKTTVSTSTEQSSQAPTSDGNVMALTAHEVLTLLSLNLGASATTTRELFRLPDRSSDEELMEMGLSTLLVRGLGALDGEDFTPAGPAFGIAASLTTAVEWLELGIVAGDANYAYFLVGSPAGNLVVSVDRLSIYQFRPLAETTSLLDQAVALTRNALTDPASPKPAVVVTRHLGSDGENTTASIRIAEDGSAALLGAPEIEGGGLSPIETAGSDVFEKYKAALAFQPAA
ncbi:MAG: hypothetical protein WBX27_09415 [Specibacter sp.]